MRALSLSLRLLAVLSVLAFAAPRARAQAIALYGTFSPTHVSNVTNGSTSSGGTSTTSYWAPGFGGGATFGLIPVGPLRLGADIRGSGSTGSSTSTLVMAGIKLGVRVPLVRLRPYVQASGGYLGTKVPIVNSPLVGANLTAHYAAYEILGGIDDPIAPFIDLRLIEVGGGQGQYLSGSPGSNNGNVSLFTVNAGIVVHF